MQIQPYLFFNGRCAEAIAFYRTALGAEVEMLMRGRDCPEPPACMPPEAADLVMHAALRIGEAVLLVSDGMESGPARFQNFALSLAVADEAEARQRFEALAEGGEIRMALDRTFFSPCFGTVTDRFGVAWMVIVPA